MKEKINFVALRTTKVNDSMSILSAYSLEHGRISFVVNASKGREANRRRALLMPLGVIECQAELKPGRGLYFMSEPHSLVAVERIYSNPVKNAVALFLAEFLNVATKESAPDAPLFRYIVESIVRLAESGSRQAANFHICFLMRLGVFMGIEPDFSTWRRGYLFDMAEGVFKRQVDTLGLRNVLDLSESEALHRLRRLNFDNFGYWRFGQNERREVLEKILIYYSMHLTAALSSLRSFDVLRMLF